MRVATAQTASIPIPNRGGTAETLLVAQALVEGPAANTVEVQLSDSSRLADQLTKAWLSDKVLKVQYADATIASVDATRMVIKVNNNSGFVPGDVVQLERGAQQAQILERVPKPQERRAHVGAPSHVHELVHHLEDHVHVVLRTHDPQVDEEMLPVRGVVSRHDRPHPAGVRPAPHDLRVLLGHPAPMQRDASVGLIGRDDAVGCAKRPKFEPEQTAVLGTRRRRTGLAPRLAG